MAPQSRGSWNVVETGWLRRGRPDPKPRRRYIVKYEWPHFGGLRVDGPQRTNRTSVLARPTGFDRGDATNIPDTD